MPRKPSSVYVIVEDTRSSVSPDPSLPRTSLTAWRIPIEDGDTAEEARKKAVDRVYHNQKHPIGSMVVAVEDTKVQAYSPTLSLEEIDDPRIPPDDDPPTP